MSGDLSRYAPAWFKTRWARILGGALAAILLLAILAPYLLDVDRYRGRISDMISLQTGRKVTMGRLRATLLLRVGFSVDGFQMANPPGFAQGHLVLAEEIHGALAFWPLVLRRELRVISLELVEPRLMLLEDDRGRNNYTFPARRPPSAPSSRPAPAGDRPASITLMVDQVAMSHAAVFYGTVDRRGRPAATVHVSNLDVELRQIALRPLRVREWQADARLGGTQLILASWNAPALFDSGTVVLRDGKLDSSFTVQFGKAARVEGTVSVPDVEDAVPQFDVKTNDLDLDALLAGTAEPLPTRGGNANPAALPGRGRAGAAVGPARAVTPAAGPSRLVAQGHIAAEHIRQGAYAAGPLTADLRVFNDRTEIWPFTLRLAGGAVQLTARTDRLQVPQRFSANIQVRELNTETILRQSPDLKGKFAGTAELEMQLIGSLETRWTESLTGHGQFAIRNGRIAGFNLAGAARSITDLAGVSGDTPFTRIAGDVSIRDGRLTSRQIHMDSPRGTLDLKGSCGFYGSLDYEGQMIAQLTGAAQPSGDSARDILSGIVGNAITRNIGQAQIAVPLILRGTLQKPDLRPGRTAPKFTQPALSTQPQETNGFSFPSIFGR
jgi:uncharacterized protein involved in outer membrane biogenesis